MSHWCSCWEWLKQPRPLTATELLVAASNNTSTRRISRANSDDSLEGGPPSKYNTFQGTPPAQDSPGAPVKCLPPRRHTSQRHRDPRGQSEMVALVRPLQRHQEQMRYKPRIDEQDTLSMNMSWDDHHDTRSLRSECDSQASPSECGDEDSSSIVTTDNVISLNYIDECDELEGDSGIEGSSWENPVDECFGSVILSTRKLSHRIVGVLLLQLRGVPWVRAHEGLSVEVRALGAAKSQWLFLPNARGPEVVVQREVTVKMPRPPHKEIGDIKLNSPWYPPSMASEQQGTGEALMVTVWPGCVDHPRYSSIGHAIDTVVDLNTTPHVLGLTGHTKIHGELGSLEISLTSSSTSSSTTSRTRGVLIKILRAHGLQKPNFHWIAKKAKKTLPDKGRLDVWCTITLWIAGEKVKKEVTPKMPMPASGDPSFLSSSTFFVPKQDQHNACLVVKIHCGRRVHEVTVGRVVLGPLLYLGSYNHPPLLPLDTSSPRPVTLSHWGRSLNSHYPVIQWHRLGH